MRLFATGALWAAMLLAGVAAGGCASEVQDPATGKYGNFAGRADDEVDFRFTSYSGGARYCTGERGRDDFGWQYERPER